MSIVADAIRKVIADRAPELLRSLRDDRSGKKPLKATQRHVAMILLRKVMTAAQIRIELDAVAAPPRKRTKR
jgi:hypothetical protein